MQPITPPRGPRATRGLALVLLAGLAACADETTLPGAPLGWGPASSTLYTPPAGGGSGLVGDWLYCEDAACAALTTSGLRFAADGTWASLHAFQLHEDGTLEYCLGWDHGTYVWSGSSLLLADAQGTALTCTVALTGDVVTIYCGDLYAGILHRFDTGAVEPCPVYEDQGAGT